MIISHTTHGGPPKPFYMQLYFQVLFGVILGVLLGHFFPDFAALFKPLGDAFIKIVKMMTGINHTLAKMLSMSTLKTPLMMIAPTKPPTTSNEPGNIRR